MQSAAFWEPLMKAFHDSAGFTTYFYLRGVPNSIEMAHLPPHDGQITGSIIPNGNTAVINMAYVVAYEIEES